jgi:UDP-N-acetylglucosamine 3-dehydrogenase
LDELLSNDEVSAVFIITPTFLHYEQCTRAIEQGRHIFLEKPIANTVEKAKRIYQVSTERNVVVSVGHNVRRRAEFRMIKRLIDSGEIGEVIMVEANNSQYVGEGRETSWRLNPSTCPGGPLLQLGVHHIDTLLYLFGDIAEVKAFLKNDYFTTEVPDTVSSVLRFKSGVLGYLSTNYLTEPSFIMRIYGTKGILSIEDTTLYLQKGRNRKNLKITPINTLEEQVKEFGKCIIGNGKPEVGAREGLKVMKVVDAIMESSSENGKVVAITRQEEDGG